MRDKIRRRKQLRLRMNDISTFQNENCKTKFISLPYNNYTNDNEKKFEYLGIRFAYETKHTLSDILENPKDKTDSFETSGIYEIYCKDCNEK